MNEVRRARFLGGPGKNEVANIDVVDGATETGGLRVELLANSCRGFADLGGRPGVSDDRRIDLPVVDHGGVIADRGRECVRIVNEHETWEDDGRVCVGYEEALGFQIGNYAVCFVDGSLELPVSFGGEPFRQELLFEAGELAFIEREKRIGAAREFGPAVAGLRLKSGRRRVDRKISITIRAIAIQVHISLHEESFAIAIGILQLKNCFAIVKIMTGEKQVQTIEPIAQILDFVLVEFCEVGRDARRVRKPCQLAEHFGELRVILNEVLPRAAGMRQFCRESNLDVVAVRFVALD